MGFFPRMVIKKEGTSIEKDLKQLFSKCNKKLKLEKQREDQIVRFLEREIIWDGKTLIESI